MKKTIRTLLFNRIMKRRLKKEESYVKSTQKNIITNNTNFDTLESYRTTRTNLMYSLATEEGCKKIIFTSPMAGEGKTTSCLNMAITFAQTGAKVLVVDADLRRPRLHSYFDLDNSQGLSNVLAGLAALDEVIQTKNGVDCITAGHIPQNPTELLASKKMEELINELSVKYDYLFLDSPPVAVVTDAATMSKLASGVVLVVRQKYTIHNALEQAITSLKFANAKILGFVLNDAEIENYSYRKGKYGYYNYYYYGSYRDKHENKNHKNKKQN